MRYPKVVILEIRELPRTVRKPQTCTNLNWLKIGRLRAGTLSAGGENRPGPGGSKPAT
jgi:hypothetical protein